MSQRRRGNRGRAGAERWLVRLFQAGAALLAITLLGALLVGCGDDDDDDDGETSDGGRSTSSPQATATPEPANEIAADLEAIQYPTDLADGMALGDTDAPATLEMFEDFQCPFCLRFTAEWEPLLIEYVEAEDLRLVFRNLPILGEESVYAAAAAVCAAEQDGFWEYHRQLFLVQAEANQHENEQLNVGRFTLDELVQYAEESGLDRQGFGACLEDPATLAAVQADYDAARDAGLRSTPSLILNGQPVQVPGNEATWRQLLDEAIE
jgi:protein-disulfide isomerase